MFIGLELISIKDATKVIAFTLVFLFSSVCIPQFCSANTIFDRFSEGERFGLNYDSHIIILNTTSGTIVEKTGRGEFYKHWYLDCRVYGQYINVTERDSSAIYGWYTVDGSRRVNETDTRVLWWIDTNIRIGDTVRILGDLFTVVGKGVQKPWMSLWECWILSRDNVVAYYDTEYGLLINLINITQVEGDAAKATVIYLTIPGIRGFDASKYTSAAAFFYTSFPPLITLTVLTSAFFITKYHLLRRIRLWLRKIRR